VTKLTTFICLALLTVAQSGPAQTAGGTAASDSRAQRYNTYSKLNRQIFHTSDDDESGRVTSRAKAAEILSQLHKLVSDEIIGILSSPGASADDVVAAINAIQDKAGSKPLADLFQLNGVKCLAVSYSILQGADAIPDTQPYLEFWDQTNGSWAMKAEAPARTDFRGHTFTVAKLDSPVPTEAWFLAWGMTIGNPGTPLKLRLYSFDGNAVRTVWKRDDLTKGKVTLSGNTVVLDYDRDYPSTGPNNRIEETLHVTGNGLE